MVHCPVGCYSSHYEINAKDNAEELDNVKYKCLKCHYSCKTCVGANDYQCVQCYPDAMLLNITSNEHYCYPISVSEKISEEKWYFATFLLLCLILIVLLVSLLICYLKRKSKYSRYYVSNTKSFDTIVQMQKKVNETVYSDSE